MADPYDRENEGEQSQSGSPDEPRTIHKNPAEKPKDEAEPRDNIRNAEESFYNPTGDEVRRHSVDRANLALAELSGSKAGPESGLFNQSAGDGSPKVFKSLKSSLKQRRKVLAGGGAAAGVGAIVLATFFLLIPLKIEHIVNNLENHFFATSEDAIQKETDSMLKGYIRRALPSYKNCGSTIDKNCKVTTIVGNGPVNNLYRTWANAKLENKLATDYGIEFKYNKSSKNWYLKAPGSNPNGDNIGPNGEGLDSDFQRADRATMRNAINEAVQNETKWKQVMYRYKVGRLLEEKYGIKRCIVFCGTKDQLADKLDEQKKAATLYFVQRVVTPRTDSTGIALECMINDCDATQTQPTQAEDGTTGELNGSPENPATDTAVRESDQQLAQGFTSATAQQLSDRVAEIEDKGLFSVLLDDALTKIGLGGISSQVADAIPVVGLVIAGSHIISFASHAGPAVQKLGYIVNSGAYAQTYQMYSTYADEIHTGKDTATEVGSFTNSLGPGNRGTVNNPQVGGTGGAESSALYQNIIDGKSPNTTTTFSNPLSGKAYAASSSGSSSDDVCKGNTPLPAGYLVCPDIVLGQVNGPLNTTSQFLNLPVVGQVTFLANKISGLANIFSGIFGSIISAIPGVGAVIANVTQLASSVLQPFFTDAVNVLIKNPISINMSGSRLFDIMAGGADVAGNLFGQVGIGGHVLTSSQVADIRNQQQTEEQQTFAHQTFFARMFSADSQYSLVSRVAMTIPFGLQADAQSGTASLLNPLSAFSHGFGSLLSGKVSAAVSAQSDPFNIAQNGYTDVDLNKIGDPAAYWDQHCSDNASFAYRKDNSWNEEAAHTVDPNTGMPENVTPNPCLLIKTTAGTSGGLFNTDNLTSDDLADQENNSSGGTNTTTPVSGNAQQLAQQILQNNNIDLTCLSSSVKQDVQDAAAGKPGTAGVPVSAAILQLIDTVGQNHQVCITAIESDGQGHTTGSYHYTGDAVDFGSLDGTTITGRNAPALTIIKIATQTLPSGSALGQSECGATPALPSGWTTFEDTCNHLHVQVPRGTK